MQMAETMVSREVSLWVIAGSMAVSIACYIWLSRREESYLNILTPGIVINIPAYYLLPLAYMGLFGKVFGSEYTAYAYVYVYATLAVESVGFVLAYLWTGQKMIRLPFALSYRNFTAAALGCLGFAVALYVPVLVKFREYIADPREIYRLTHTGFGLETYVSSILGLLAVVFILFTHRRWFVKCFVVISVAGLLWLHGSKGQVLTLVFLLLLFGAYVKGKKVGFLGVLMGGLGVAGMVLALFALTMQLGGSAISTLETISSYSDFTQNAMLVIDSRLPAQDGRLTLEANTYALVPRALMPGKRKDFGTFYLAKKFYPAWYFGDTGSPAFGIGVQYADFGCFAVLYLLLFSLLRGWLARIFVNRLKLTRHPADFVIVAFLAGVSIFPIGGVGWLFPEALVVALLIRYLSRLGARPVLLGGHAGELSHA